MVGVQQKLATGKWYGKVADPLKTTKWQYTPCVATKAEAIAAWVALKARIEKEYWDSRTERARENPLTRNISRAPDNIADAAPQTAYWVANRNTKHLPQRMVRVGTGRGKDGFKWRRACQDADGCVHMAVHSHDGKRDFCAHHGGKECPCGNPVWTTCMKCNGGAEGKKWNNVCCVCNAWTITAKRQKTNGGNGMCPSCEKSKTVAAKEAGMQGPLTAQRTEDRMLDAVCAQVVDEKGFRISHESRNNYRHMLGSRKRSECDARQRRSDALFLKRDADSRICGGLVVEVDEHSHQSYTSECEGGKIDDTFQSFVKLAQDEGKDRSAVVRGGTIRTPYLLFLRVNPDACDLGYFEFNLRCKVVAELVSTFLNEPPATFHAMADADRTMCPHVQCLYYHTQKGKQNMNLYAASGGDSLVWRGNACPTRVGEVALF